MESSSNKTQNQKRYISNQDILAIQKSLKEPCNIYGMLKVGLIGIQNLFTPDCFIWFNLPASESHSNHNNSRVRFYKFHHLFILHSEYKMLLSFKVRQSLNSE